MPEVTMQDGTKLEFGERTKALKQSYISEDGALVVKFAFKNGEIKEYRMAADHPLLHKAALHGLNQKFGDANASLDDVEDMLEAFDDVAAQMEKGEWNEKRGGDGLAGVSVLAKALVEFTGKSRDEVKAMLANLSAAEKQALRKAAPLVPIITQIEAERDARSSKKAGVDGGALLAALQGQA
jgi:hypothetical protein